MNRSTIAVVILTKNEEKNIGPCIESVAWADEVIVVDDQSSDNTVSAAVGHNAKVLVRPLGKDFAAQRNAGADEARSDWILQMDADERVSDGLKADILSLLEKDTPHSAFNFIRKNNFCGKFLEFGGEDLHRPVRLYRRGKARFAGTRIHEILAVQGSTGELSGVMEHYNFPSVGHYIETQNFYTDLEAAALFEKDGSLDEKTIRREMGIGAVKLFMKIYFKRKGYRDGTRGLVFAILSAWRRFLIYAKYWELCSKNYGR